MQKDLAQHQVFFVVEYPRSFDGESRLHAVMLPRAALAPKAQSPVTGAFFVAFSVSSNLVCSRENGVELLYY